MKILVIGSGAREHALVATLQRDAGVEVYCAPGNAGISLIAETFPVTATDGREVLALAQQLAVDLVVIGPEAPLVAGVSDVVRDAGIPVFGPSAAAAQLEGSKAFAKQVMQDAGVPTARAHLCKTISEAEVALDDFGAPYVVKDDGLAAGKGVVVTSDRNLALEHARICIEGRHDGAVVIEEYLDGPEVSLFGITDGVTVIPLSPAQDFKRVANNDQGPNTGGMGAYTPLPWAPSELSDEVVAKVLQPTIDEMAKRGTPFVGLLYAGLALTSRGTRVIEFNARFGDPETQVVLTRLDSALSTLLLASATGTLATQPEVKWKNESVVTVVMAAEGYPESPVSGAVISGLENVSNATVFHAGTRANETGDIVVSGGRVLTVTASGNDLHEARKNAYLGVSKIKFSGAHHRTDIAERAANGEVHVP